MAVYSKQQMTEKPKPTPGWHTMQIKREAPTKDRPSQHTFVLENENFIIWFSPFLSAIPKLGEKCGAEADLNGNMDTAGFVNRWIDVYVDEKPNPKDLSKPYRNVIDFKESDSGKIPAMDQATSHADEDIPF